MKRSAPLPTLAGALALAALPVPAGAQTVRGTLVQHPGGEPLPGGSVLLIDHAQAAVDSTRSAPDGTFTLRSPGGGEFILYFTHPGYAAVPSVPIRLEAGQTLEHRFSVPLVSGRALERMSETVELERQLQGDIVELCGERPRSWEAGILVGVVRRRDGGEPLAGAIVQVEAPGAEGAEPFHKATVSSANGVYVLCNVPPGTVTSRAELAGYAPDEGPVQVHAGNIGWYDVYLRRHRGSREKSKESSGRKP